MQNETKKPPLKDPFLTWWEGLGRKRGDRAVLRRATSPQDILLTSVFFNFLKETGQKDKKNLLAYAAVAAVTSHVETNSLRVSRFNEEKRATFAELLGTGADGQKAPMSELRFQQLQKSRTEDEFFVRIIRAVKLLRGTVNLFSLRDDILQWHAEKQSNFRSAHPLVVKWATEYFTALEKNK